jgi:hypothetical protein
VGYPARAFAIEQPAEIDVNEQLAVLTTGRW